MTTTTRRRMEWRCALCCKSKTQEKQFTKTFSTCVVSASSFCSTYPNCVMLCTSLTDWLEQQWSIISLLSINSVHPIHPFAFCARCVERLKRYLNNFKNRMKWDALFRVFIKCFRECVSLFTFLSLFCNLFINSLLRYVHT